MSSFKFDVLEFSVSGDGVFVGGERFDAAIAAIPADNLKAVNAAAWKMLRSANRQCERYANVSVHGDRPYDAAFQNACVADAVRKATWRRMQAA